MVLASQPQNPQIWGTGPPGMSLQITLDSELVGSTAVSQDGTWFAALDPQEPGGPHEIVVSALLDANVNATMADVLFGLVFLCSGQSNMQFSISQLNLSQVPVPERNMDLIRLFTVGQTYGATEPQSEFYSVEQEWVVASLAALNDPQPFSYFSAVCWLTAIDYFATLDYAVPIALVSTNWGGTAVQLWSSPDALAQCDQNIGPKLNSNCAPGPPFVPPVGVLNNSTLFNSMIAPLLLMRVHAVLWYQGEANVACVPGVQPYIIGDSCGMNASDCADYYACQFAAMIADWRVKFHIPDLPFVFVQLAPYTETVGQPGDEGLPLLRGAQLAALELPAVGFATAIDLGTPVAPWGNIHPLDKVPLAARMAVVLDALLAGTPPPTGPMLSSASSLNSTAMELVFTGAAQNMLVVRAVPACPVPWFSCMGLELMDESGAWRNDTVVSPGLRPATLVVELANAPHALLGHARYAWADWPLAFLYDVSGLPAIPFAF